MNKNVQKIYAAIGALEDLAGGNCLISNFISCSECKLVAHDGRCGPRVVRIELRNHLNENREEIENGNLRIPRKKKD